MIKKLGLPPNLAKQMVKWSREMPNNLELSTDLTWDNADEKSVTLSQHSGVSKDKAYCYYHGVAQGSPLSPTLSTILLVPIFLLSSKFKSIFYADDGILYDPSPGADPIDY